MATEIETTVRRHWAWRKRGDARWLPMPIDPIDIPQMYTFMGFYYISILCVVPKFKEYLEDDLDDVFINTDEFAIPGIYIDSENNSYSLPGIYSYPYQEASPDVTVGMQSMAPIYKIQESDIVGVVKRGDKLKICHGTFEVVEARPDGVGVMDLTLHKVPTT